MAEQSNKLLVPSRTPVVVRRNENPVVHLEGQSQRQSWNASQQLRLLKIFVIFQFITAIGILLLGVACVGIVLSNVPGRSSVGCYYGQSIWIAMLAIICSIIGIVALRSNSDQCLLVSYFALCICTSIMCVYLLIISTANAGEARESLRQFRKFSQNPLDLLMPSGPWYQEGIPAAQSGVALNICLAILAFLFGLSSLLASSVVCAMWLQLGCPPATSENNSPMVLCTHGSIDIIEVCTVIIYFSSITLPLQDQSVDITRGTSSDCAYIGIGSISVITAEMITVLFGAGGMALSNAWQVYGRALSRKNEKEHNTTSGFYDWNTEDRIGVAYAVLNGCFALAIIPCFVMAFFGARRRKPMFLLPILCISVLLIIMCGFHVVVEFVVVSAGSEYYGRFIFLIPAIIGFFWFCFCTYTEARLLLWLRLLRRQTHDSSNEMEIEASDTAISMTRF